MDDPTAGQRLAVVDETVVVAEAFEDLWVDDMGGAEPATAEVDPGDVAARDTRVDDLHAELGNATWHSACGALGYHYVAPDALVSPHTVRFNNCIPWDPHQNSYI